jgi:hypothetical protein
MKAAKCQKSTNKAKAQGLKNKESILCYKCKNSRKNMFPGVFYFWLTSAKNEKDFVKETSNLFPVL